MELNKLLPQLKGGDLLHREAAKAIEKLLLMYRCDEEIEEKEDDEN